MVTLQRLVKAFISEIAGLIWTVGLLGYSVDVITSILYRDIAGQQVCLEIIKCSAKYAWQYQVVVSIDGERQLIKCYNCRPSTGIPNEATASSKGITIRQLVCDLVIH